MQRGTLSLHNNQQNILVASRSARHALPADASASPAALLPDDPFVRGASLFRVSRRPSPPPPPPPLSAYAPLLAHTPHSLSHSHPHSQSYSQSQSYLHSNPPPPPPPSMASQMGHPMMPLQNGMYPAHIPQPPPRLGPLPSAPIPQYNAMMPSVAIYDPAILANPMDPYSLMNKTRALYNPVTKKPQNYRTVPCRRFHSADGCERGDNCHFIHDFQFQGRPIPNFHDWKNNNMTRQRNVQGMNNYNMGVPEYYPPQGPEGNYEKR